MSPKRILPTQDSSDEEEEASQSQSFSQSQIEISADERKQLSGQLCNYLLLNECKKIPSKSADMKRLVLKDKARAFNQLMQDASNLLKEVYGYKVVQLQSKAYILINAMEDVGTILDDTVANNEEVKGFLTIVLIGIFMSGGMMKEGPMHEYLKNFEVDIDSKAPHPVFGNIDKLIHQDLKRQQYLDIGLDKTTDPATREYRWGERATLELPKKQVLELVCKVYGNSMRPEMWLTQWQAVQREGRSIAEKKILLKDRDRM